MRGGMNCYDDDDDDDDDTDDDYVGVKDVLIDIKVVLDSLMVTGEGVRKGGENGDAQVRGVTAI